MSDPSSPTPPPSSRPGGCLGCVLVLGLVTTASLLWVLPALGVEVPEWALLANVVIFLVLLAMAGLGARRWKGRRRR